MRFRLTCRLSVPVNGDAVLVGLEGHVDQSLTSGGWCASMYTGLQGSDTVLDCVPAQLHLKDRGYMNIDSFRPL